MLTYKAALTAAAFALLLGGCGWGRPSKTKAPSTTPVHSEKSYQRQIAQTNPTSRSLSPREIRTSLGLEAPAPEPTDSNTQPSTPPQATRFVMDGMVGQINGKAVYASDVFGEIGEDQLIRLGQSNPRLAFRDQAVRLIRQTLQSRIFNALIVAEAERGLSQQEQLGLLGYLKQEREKLLAQYGGGSLAQANQRLKQERGSGLDEALEDRRKQILIEKYLGEKLRPKIHVNRREVERYYRDHPQEFNPSPSATVRVILVQSASAADEVDKALAEGVAFEEVARKHSIARANEGGLMPTFALKGPLSQFNELAWKELNEKVRTLKVGQYSERTPIGGNFGWIKLEKLEGGESRSLQEAYLEIETRLRQQKYKTLYDKYMLDLLENGNFTPLDEMSTELLRVAMDRFAKAQ